MRDRTSKASARLKRHMAARSRPVEVTPRKIRIWWSVINEAAFDGKLPIPRFNVHRMKKTWGSCLSYEYDVKITINSDINTKELFMGTLAHEMVHQWQFHRGMRMSHTDSYLRWAKKFKERYGIIL